MNNPTNLGGSFTLPSTSLTLHRFGYGAMQLAGKGVFGPPRDEEGALAVLREVVELGINHIDTSDFYGPHVTNQLIKKALHPYPDDLTLVTKVGALRGDDGSWNPALSPEDLKGAVHSNLKNLGVETLAVVNLRLMGGGAGHGPSEGSLEEPLLALVELQKQGLIQHIGLSNVTSKQVAQAREFANIVCVQNQYNLAHREDDDLITEFAELGIAYVPFFPLGGFSPLQSSTLEQVAQELNATPLQVALAWLLQRSPNILLIPGTSSVAHLRENLKATQLQLSDEIVARLDEIGA